MVSAGSKGLAECKASAKNLRRIQVKDIVKEVKDYLKTYSSAGMDISWYVEIYESETQRVTIQASSSKALISNNQFQDSDSDVEEDLRSSSEFIAILNTEYHERALLANQKRFYKRPGVIAEIFDWDEESISLEDEGTTKIKAFMAIAEEDPSVGKADARSGQWVEITMKNLHRLLSMTDSNERKHVLDYTHVDLHYIEDQRKNLEPLPPLPKLIGAAPADTLNSLISSANLTLNMADLTLNTYVPKKTKPT
ncbi:hypothetical protein Tco_0927546 [Tanacetum coccineum]